MKKVLRDPLAGVAWLVLVMIGLALLPGSGLAQEESPVRSLGEGPTLVVLAEEVEGGSGLRIPAVENFLQAESAQLSTINVTYVGDWDPDAKNAFEYAKHIWELNFSSPVPVEVVAEWEAMSSGVLGSASAADYLADFSGAPFRETWYPVVLANKLAGKDWRPTQPDISASFNSAFSLRGGWYKGLDGLVDDNHWDLASVVLHELGHGLGFSGSMVLSGTSGRWGYAYDSKPSTPYYPFIFDRFAVNGLGQSLIDTNRFPNPSTLLGTQLISNNLFFYGDLARAANGGESPKLYAPSSWQQGSSFSHLDESTYAKSSANALMTPQLANGEAIHNPGPIALAILADMEKAVPVPPQKSNVFLPVLAKSYPCITGCPSAWATEASLRPSFQPASP